jgi:hypothetical protein
VAISAKKKCSTSWKGRKIKTKRSRRNIHFWINRITRISGKN